jgi:hypothetical protein
MCCCRAELGKLGCFLKFWVFLVFGLSKVTGCSASAYFYVISSRAVNAWDLGNDRFPRKLLGLGIPGIPKSQQISWEMIISQIRSVHCTR